MSTNVNTSINLSDESYYNSQHQHGTHTQIQQVAQSVLALQKEEGRAEKNINVMYGKEDLSSSALFCGKEKGFINFGYWKDISVEPNKPISSEQRSDSQIAMYRLVADTLQVSNKDSIAEIGCGTGKGALWIAQNFRPRTIVGVDYVPDQVKRANQNKQVEVAKQTVKDEDVSFIQGNAVDLNQFDHQSFTALYSVEAAQHFPDIYAFIGEAERVLTDNGRLVFVTFMGTRSDAMQTVAPLIPTVRDGIDHLWDAESVQIYAQKVGFSNVVITPIGEHVWGNWWRWTDQVIDPSTNWSGNWYRCWKEHSALDYFLVSAEKKVA